MICRLWRGIASPEKAAAYENIVRTQVIPGIEAKRIEGLASIDLMRRELASGEVEFQTLMWFDSLMNVKGFTGVDFERAHVPAEARVELQSFDSKVSHYVVLDRNHRPDGVVPGRLVRFDRAALVIIDVQKGFEDPEWGDRNNENAEANVAKLLEAWRAAGWPVHHVHHASRSPLGKFRLGTPGHDAKVEARPLPSERIHVKEVNSGFIGTQLEETLRSDGVKTLVIAGLTSNHCVSTTVRMAGNLGFETFLVADASATFARVTLGGRMRPAEEVHEAALSDLHEEFAKIVSTSDVLSALRSAQRV